MLDEEAAVGIEHEIRRRASERNRHREDAFFAAFDLDERADGRLVDGDDDVFGGVLLAVLLVAEPHVQAELLEHALQHFAVANDGLVLVAHLHRSGQHGTFEGQQVLARLGADAQHAAAPAQRFILRIEQGIFLQTAGAKGGGTSGKDRRARIFRAGEPEFDFTLDHQRHVGLQGGAICITKRKGGSERTRLSLRRSVCAIPSSRPRPYRCRCA